MYRAAQLTTQWPQAVYKIKICSTKSTTPFTPCDGHKRNHTNHLVSSTTWSSRVTDRMKPYIELKAMSPLTQTWPSLTLKWYQQEDLFLNHCPVPSLTENKSKTSVLSLTNFTQLEMYRWQDVKATGAKPQKKRLLVTLILFSTVL